MPKSTCVVEFLYPDAGRGCESVGCSFGHAAYAMFRAAQWVCTFSCLPEIVWSMIPKDIEQQFESRGNRRLNEAR